MGTMSAAPKHPPHPGHDEIGLRVTMRLNQPGGQTELVGILQTLTSVQRRTGDIVTFDPAHVVTWRIVKSG
ncbi:hypothetical protein LBMAG15_08180 [Actinomycetes bacterium]|nr:hypothetical protein LBMAG15_08180 [Actinomycetes bacterium]